MQQRNQSSGHTFASHQFMSAAIAAMAQFQVRNASPRLAHGRVTARQHRQTTSGTTPTVGTTAVSYGYVAHAGPEAGFALRHQDEVCQQAIEGLDAKRIAAYVDLACSGSALERPGLTSLLRQVAAFGASYVVVERADRLSRRPDEFLEITRHLEAAGAEIVVTEVVLHGHVGRRTVSAKRQQAVGE